MPNMAKASVDAGPPAARVTTAGDDPRRNLLTISNDRVSVRFQCWSNARLTLGQARCEDRTSCSMTGGSWPGIVPAYLANSGHNRSSSSLTQSVMLQLIVAFDDCDLARLLSRLCDCLQACGHRPNSLGNFSHPHDTFPRQGLVIVYPKSWHGMV